MGKLLKIYLRPERRKDVTAVESAKVVKGSGLEGDHCKKGKRQVTILSIEAWKEACAEIKTDLDPSCRRANLLIEGVDLRESIGQTLEVGPVRIRIFGETAPCRLMDEIYDGLKDALASDWRGGVFGEVITEGKIQVGDSAEWRSHD